MYRVLALLPVPLTLTACGPQGADACRLTYAPDTVHVSFEGPDEAWAVGEWTVEADNLSCTVDLTSGERLGCDEALGVQVDDGQLLGFVLNERAPDSLGVVLLHDGAVVHEATVYPAYVTEEPNGAGCGIRQAGESSILLP